MTPEGPGLGRTILPAALLAAGMAVGCSRVPVSRGTCAARHCPRGCTDGTCPVTPRTYPGGPPLKLDDGQVVALRAAPWMPSVLVLRRVAGTTPPTGVLSLVLDDYGIGIATRLTGSVALDPKTGAPLAGFSELSGWVDGFGGVYFVAQRGGTRALMIAHSDGTGARTLAPAIVGDPVLVYDRLFYETGAGSGTVQVEAAQLPAGKPVEIVPGGTFRDPRLLPCPDASAVLVAGGPGTPLRLVQSATGDGVDLPLGKSTLARAVWSGEGHLVYLGADGTLRIAATDGTGSADVLDPGEVAEAPVFVPWNYARNPLLAYGVDGAGGDLAEVVVHPLAGGADATLTLPTGHRWSAFTLSPDGSEIAATDGAGDLAVGPLAGGTASIVATDLKPEDDRADPPIRYYRFDPLGRQLAVVSSAARLTLYPVGGGAGTTLSARPIAGPAFFEGRYPDVFPDPALLAFVPDDPSAQPGPGTVVLHPGGGGADVDLAHAVAALSRAQAVHADPFAWFGTLPGLARGPLSWGFVGSEALYEDHAGSGAGFALHVLTDDGTRHGDLATGVDVWAAGRGTTWSAFPTRIFFGKAGQPGLWMAGVPHTPPSAP